MWRSVLQRVVRRGTGVKYPWISQAGLLSSRAGSVGALERPHAVREATDTLDLIDQLLGVLGDADSRDPGFVFFDLDETIVTRDTCLVDGFHSTKAVMSRLEAKLGASSEILRTIHGEMEKDYYEADPRLVDPLLARVIRALKVQGHSVFGLTSNGIDNIHTPRILETLAKYKIRFSVPEVRGELPRTGALVMDHPVSRGVIFLDNQQTRDHDKGEVIAEFVGLLLHNGSDDEGGSHPMLSRGTAEASAPFVPTSAASMQSARGDGVSSGYLARGDELERGRTCVLVDNTSRKCEKAAKSFWRTCSNDSLEFHAVHFTEAENLVGSPDALSQLRRILGRLKAQGVIGDELKAEDFGHERPD